MQVLIRQELGQDISSACGQLVIENSVRPSKSCSSEQPQGEASAPDIEDLLKRKRKIPSAAGTRPISPPRRSAKKAQPVKGSETAVVKRRERAC